MLRFNMCVRLRSIRPISYDFRNIIYYILGKESNLLPLTHENDVSMRTHSLRVSRQVGYKHAVLIVEDKLF
jgi:hypothetical protein